MSTSAGRNGSRRLRGLVRMMSSTSGWPARPSFGASETLLPAPALAAAAEEVTRSASGARVAALLGLSAATAALIAESRCEASPSDTVSVDAIKHAVRQLWQQLEEELQRVEASMPAGTELSIPEPEVTVESGGSVMVAFQLPQQADIPGMLATLRRLLRSMRFGSVGAGIAGASVSEESSSGQEGRARRFVRRSSALGDLQVEVTEPRDSAQPARIEFRGRPTHNELQLMSAVLHSAMRAGRRTALQELDDFGQLFEGSPFGRALEGMDPFLGHLREFIEEFGQLRPEGRWGMGPEVGEEDEEDGWWGPRDTLPTPPRRSKRWDELGVPEGATPPRRTPGGGSAGEPAPSAEEREAAARARKLDTAVKKLQAAGAQVFLPGNKEEVDWGILAGYEEQKRAIEDTLLLALQHPEVYNDIAKGTRQHYSPNRPRAVLFEGPPGTGKTTSARVIATQAAVPLAYIPLESIVSKWYGESEQKLADMLKACESLPDGCIVFLDELDALATTRGNDMHEATRRLLGVLLRHLDGFDTSKRTVVIGATNRKQDLDPALLSRFDTSITFGLPNESCRAAILSKYARHLSDVELSALACLCVGMAGRDLRDICEQAERRWASKIIRGQAPKGQLPSVQEYMDAARQRAHEQGGVRPHG